MRLRKNRGKSREEALNAWRKKRKADPFEQVNLADAPKHQDVLKRMRWRNRVCWKWKS